MATVAAPLLPLSTCAQDAAPSVVLYRPKIRLPDPFSTAAYSVPGAPGPAMPRLMRRSGWALEPTAKPVTTLVKTALPPVAALVDFHTPSERTAA